MKKIMLLLILAVVLISGSLYAMCGTCGTGKAHEEGKAEIINTNCPVTGEEITGDTPYRIEYEGEQIGFCCPACEPAFKAEPEKYMKKIHMREETETKN